ncbi:MAG: hypothetical protein HY927_06840 [Elusimicrobia bacterium]|nr:hypothetical protein [Elusimicrobiota bacterium]
MSSLSPAFPLFVFALLLPGAARGEDSCQASYDDSYEAKTCGYALPKDEWNAECAKGRKPENIILQYCRKAYDEDYEKEYAPDGAPALKRGVWHELCGKGFAPYVILAAFCQQSYKPQYEQPYGLGRSRWESYCDECLYPRDIVALHQQDCLLRYEASHARLGIGKEDWKKLCDGGLSGKTPGRFIVDKKIERALKTPADKLSISDAMEFLALTSKKDSDPAVAKKRAELEALLGKARVNQKRFGAKMSQTEWDALPVGAATADSEERFRSLSASIDLAGFAKAALGDSVFAALSLGGGAADDRPAKPVLSKKGLDRPLDAPEKVRGGLMDKVNSLALLTDEKGKPLYDAKTIGILRDIVGSVPIGRGQPPATDLVALEDARRTVEVMAKHHPAVVWDDAMSAYGSMQAEYNDDGSLKGLTLRIRPASKDGKAYGGEMLAGVMLHEVGGHGHLDSIGGGANMFVHELAWEPEFRYYHNKAVGYEEAIRARQAQLEELRKGKDAGGKAARLEREIAALREKKGAMLDEYGAELLALYQSDPEGFRLRIVSSYYGQDNEMKPGRLTVDEQAKDYDDTDRDARRLLDRVRADKPLWRRWWGLKAEGEETAEELLALTKKKRALLKKDSAFLEESVRRSEQWRQEKVARCQAQLDADRKYAAALDALMREERKKKPNPKEVERLEGVLEDVRSGYADCSVF